MIKVKDNKSFRPNSIFISAIIALIFHIGLFSYLENNLSKQSILKIESLYTNSRKIFLIDKINYQSKMANQTLSKKDGHKSNFQGGNPSQVKPLNLSDLGISKGSKVSSNTLTNPISDKIGKYGDDLVLNNNPQLSSSIYQYLYNYIASNLHYPEILRKRKIEGYATVRIVFDSKGNYKKEFTKINSNTGYLKVLVSRTFKTIFSRPLPFNLQKIIGDSPYFFFDASFRFEAEMNSDEKFVIAHAYINQNHLSFLIQKDIVSSIGFRKNDEGIIKLGINTVDIVDWAKLNFTAAGKLKKIFEEEQVERYKNDPDWDI